MEKNVLFDLIAGYADFISRFRSARVLYLTGRNGTGKSNFATFLSADLQALGMTDCTVANYPIAWGRPVIRAPYKRVCYILDELGWFYDARESTTAAANRFRKTVVAFPRKLQSYIVISSRIVVDKTFRGLTAQRLYPLPFGFSVWAYSEDEGVNDNSGLMVIPNLVPYREYYSHLYIPSEVDKMAEHILRAIDVVKGAPEDPNETVSDVIRREQAGRSLLGSGTDVPLSRPAGHSLQLSPSFSEGLSGQDSDGGRFSTVEGVSYRGSGIYDAGSNHRSAKAPKSIGGLSGSASARRVDGD